MQNALNSACHIVREQYKPYIHISTCLYIYIKLYIIVGAFLVAQMAKNLMQCKRPGFDP